MVKKNPRRRWWIDKNRLTFLVAIGAAAVVSFSVRFRFLSSGTTVVGTAQDVAVASCFVSCLTVSSIFDLITNLNAGFCWLNMSSWSSLMEKRNKKKRARKNVGDTSIFY